MAMVNRLTRLLPLLLGVASIAAAPTDETIRPGYWESVSQVAPLAAKTDRRCITSEQVSKFLSGPGNHIYHCTYPTQELGGGKLAFAGECVDKKGHRYPIHGEGEYTPTTLKMVAYVRLKVGGLPFTLEAVTNAHRIGDTCPPETAAK
jgi:hypothetical protein